VLSPNRAHRAHDRTSEGEHDTEAGAPWQRKHFGTAYGKADGDKSPARYRLTPAPEPDRHRIGSM
jgi:hypothetical protein